ncbi:MAG: TolC family protein [Elusimicrobiales bacterium]
MIAALCAAALALCAPAQAAPAHFSPPEETLTLDQALRLGLANNTDVLSAEQDLIIARQRVREAVFLFFPQTSLTGTATKSNLKYPQLLMPETASHILFPSDYENFYTARASLLQPIYVGGRNSSTLRLAKASLMQAQTRYDSAKRDASLAVRKSFYSLLHSSASLAAMDYWIAGMRGAAAQSKPGAWEALEEDAAIEAMSAQKQSAWRSHQNLRLDFLRAINRELDSAVDIAGDFAPQPAKADLGKLTVWAMEMRPELKGETYKAEMDSIAVNLAMSRRYPTVMLGASYDVVGEQFPLKSNSWETTLAVQFPLSYNLWTQVEQKRAEQRQGDLKRSALQDKVRLEIRQAYEDNAFWQEEVPQREAVYRRLAGRYGETARSAVPGISALRAAREVCAAQLAWLEAVRGQLDSRARLEWALGQELPAQ